MSRVLIVDDEKSIRLTLRAFLVADGYEVEIAEDATQALALLKEVAFDVVVSDIILPGISGVALLAKIRALAPAVQVIMMTGEPTIETAVEAVRAGASDYLSKPVGKPAVLQAVSTAAKIKELTDEKARLEGENESYRNNLEQVVAERTGDLASALSKLQKAQQQLVQQERMSALGQMTSGIAHDFNNVLMPIMGLSEVMLADPKAFDDRESAISMLETIHSAGDDARHIVRRLRQIYKEEEPDYSLIDLETVTESVLSMTMPKWKAEAQAKGLNIEIVTEFEDVPSIKGDTSELREALTNLIFNAVDAMPAGGVITLRVKCEGGRGVVLEVSDTGVGMDDDTARQCIEPFFTTKGVQGTGLGLPMVYGIVQRHAGSMTIKGTPGVGTTVRMQFPVPVDQKQLAEDTVKDIEALLPLRVLVIDDEYRSRNFISTMLTSDGHTTRMADGGQEGVDLCRQEEFDLVITDRAMPSMNGDIVAAEISRDRPGMPIIMLTGFGDIMQDEGECPVGVTRVMSKPVTRMDLRHVMAWTMQRTEGSPVAADKK